MIQALLFALVTLCSYSCWAFGASWLGSPAALYAACSFVFLVFGSFSLFPLVRDRCTRLRFFGIYLGAFAAYAMVWIFLWQLFPDKHGEMFGFMGGLIAMSSVFRWGLGRPNPLMAGAALLFLYHSAGYYLGEMIYQQLLHSHTALARLAWGLGHGLGFGFGLFFALRPSEMPASSTDAAASSS